MNPIRVLIVDDSVIARRVITNALLRHEGVSVVGTAANGYIAIAKLPQLSPDAVILDVEMPEMDGIATLKQIRELYPKLPVIMFSSLTERSARVTLDALAAGADDYILKPSAQQGETVESVVDSLLLPKLRAVVPRSAARVESIAPVVLGSASANRHAGCTSGILSSAPEVVALAASTGGPNALAEVIPSLSANLPVPVVVVQHMPAIFTRCLAERLNGRAAVKVMESGGNEVLMPGTVYLAPGDYHLELISRDGEVRTALSMAPMVNNCRPAADVLFRSVARVYGPKALAVILTGMGQDGLAGARAIVDAGGQVIAQERDSCVVWGMPRAVEEAGLCSEILPLGQIAAAIERRVRLGGEAFKAAGSV